MSPFDAKRNPTIGGSRRIDPRYGLLHKALNLRRSAAALPPGNSSERELKKLLESGAVTAEQLDAHERDVEAHGSPLYTIPKRSA
jgi:hypothetical protein